MTRARYKILKGPPRLTPRPVLDPPEIVYVAIPAHRVPLCAEVVPQGSQTTITTPLSASRDQSYDLGLRYGYHGPWTTASSIRGRGRFRPRRYCTTIFSTRTGSKSHAHVALSTTIPHVPCERLPIYWHCINRFDTSSDGLTPLQQKYFAHVTVSWRALLDPGSPVDLRRLVNLKTLLVVNAPVRVTMFRTVKTQRKKQRLGRPYLHFISLAVAMYVYGRCVWFLIRQSWGTDAENLCVKMSLLRHRLLIL
jgi:hypothetical protein